MSAKKILIDDVLHEFSIDEEIVDCKGMYEFDKVLNILLAPKQLESFTIKDSRVFRVSQKKIDKMFEYINSSNNIWRN